MSMTDQFIRRNFLRSLDPQSRKTVKAVLPPLWAANALLDLVTSKSAFFIRLGVHTSVVTALVVSWLASKRELYTVSGCTLHLAATIFFAWHGLLGVSPLLSRPIVEMSTGHMVVSTASSVCAGLVTIIFFHVKLEVQTCMSQCMLAFTLMIATLAIIALVLSLSLDLAALEELNKESSWEDLVPPVGNTVACILAVLTAHFVTRSSRVTPVTSTPQDFQAPHAITPRQDGSFAAPQQFGRSIAQSNCPQQSSVENSDPVSSRHLAQLRPAARSNRQELATAAQQASEELRQENDFSNAAKRGQPRADYNGIEWRHQRDTQLNVITLIDHMSQRRCRLRRVRCKVLEYLAVTKANVLCQIGFDKLSGQYVLLNVDSSEESNVSSEAECEREWRRIIGS
mmetsp:Transcript_40443/g.72667  ORF Transcript_40443/g.72667 Transcript_40443/m.72667 type:complete len:398 (+) Transcript_40443:35-1228(+)